MNISKYKVLFYYKNLNLWKNITITNLKKKKWNNLKNNIKVSRGKYIYHYKKLKIEKIEEITLPNSDIKRNIIIVKKVNKTPTKYPRKAGTPSKEPL